jgi:hypothetical protein
MPLGYVTRGRTLLLWVVFAAVFLVALLADALVQGDYRTMLWELTLPPVWLFLLSSAIFTFLGQQLRRRRFARVER